MKLYCELCSKTQPVRIDNCRDAKTNEPYQDIVCAECDFVIASGTDIAQPEREPVAWMHNFIEGNVITHKPADIDRNPERWTSLYSEPKPCPTCEALARTVMMDQTSHDTAPPNRKWVELTDDQIAEAVGDPLDMIYLQDFRKVLAKCKEVNT